MTYNISIVLFFYVVCVSAFGQDLQSPQINQNAIFANPGLAGSKGCTRVSSALSFYNSSQQISSGWDSNGNLLSKTIQKREMYNGLISIDGLLLKNRLGIAGYLKSGSYIVSNFNNSYQNNIAYDPKSIKYNYSNFNMGFMLAPKFHLTGKRNGGNDHVLSPAFAIGLIVTQFNYSGTKYYNYTTQDSIKDGDKKISLGLDYMSASLLYSSSKSYSGIKFNFEIFKNTFILHSISFIYAKTYSNRKVENPKFAFTPQFNFTFPTYEFYRLTNSGRYNQEPNKHNGNNYLNLNLDFRYGKAIFGTFVGLVEFSGFYGGLTGGIQLKNTKIVLNYSPRFSPKDHGSGGLFLSANFYLTGQKEQYK
jgi:hypothetical protein